MNLETLKFPIGRFQKPSLINDSEIENWIADIVSFPIKLQAEVSNLTEEQLLLTYRPEGWNIRQIVHHCADSHMNSFIRFKLALTEVVPTIKPYFEDRWAELADYSKTSVESSLKIIEGLHQRWVVLLEDLSKEQLKRSFIHPEHGMTFSLDEIIALYAWHCNHHLAHIKIALSGGKH
jgi:hypothetical protein